MVNFITARVLQRFLCVIALLPTISHAYDLLPLRETRAGAISGVMVNDTFYTTYLNDYFSSISQQYVNHGIAAWLPCSLDTVLGPSGEIGSAKSSSDVNHAYNSYPYANSSFACLQPTGSSPLYRLWKGSPAYDHTYTTSSTEFYSLISEGYEYDRVDGYVFTSQVTGTTPLYRLSIGVGIPNHDVEHRYTVSSSARQSLINDGWTDEGTTGYVFAAPNTPSVQATGINGHFNGYTVSTGTVTTIPIQNTLPSTTQYSLYAWGNMSDTTVKPSGAVWQQIQYVIDTGDIFNDPAGSGSNFSHLPVFLHYLGTPTKSDLAVDISYDGVALVLATTDATGAVQGTGGPACATADHTTGQLYFEFDEGRLINGVAFKNLLCDPKLSINLASNARYQVTYQMDDSGNVKVTVGKYNVVFGTYDLQTFVKSGTTTFAENLSSYFSCPINPAFGSLSANQSYCANPASPDHWPVGNTGYMMEAIWGNNSSDPYPTTPDNSADTLQVTHHWLNANGIILN